MPTKSTKQNDESKTVTPQTPEEAVKNNKSLVLLEKDGRRLAVNERLVADHERRGWRRVAD